jgi:hypothetical protein
MNRLENNIRVPGSFRDPSGFVFHVDGRLYRQVNVIYKDQYDQLMNSGLYEALVNSQLLVPHEEIEAGPLKAEEAYKIIQPETVDFTSYPYEWCFSQLKNAALASLEIQKIALDHGMSLKDCSAYNIQFHQGKPILIDTLSFEKYAENRPWAAYRQFCQHFLAPLSLMSFTDVRLSQMLRVYIDGIPLDLASRLLPFRTRFSPSLLAHIYFHAKQQARYAGKRIDPAGLRISLRNLNAIIDQLRGVVSGLRWHPGGTEWADYYQENNYSSEAFEHKKEIVADFLSRLNPRTVWDMGANTGVFSNIAGSRKIFTLSLDVDPAAVELNYLACVKSRQTHVLPLVIDLTNPSPAIGWHHKERMSLVERGPADTALALALVHHLAISNNVPWERIAGFFNNICESLIIEFVPKTDSQVQRLLASREDVFPDYTKPGFEQAFARYFDIEGKIAVRHSERMLYLMRKRKGGPHVF